MIHLQTTWCLEYVNFNFFALIYDQNKRVSGLYYCKINERTLFAVKLAIVLV